MTSIKDTVIKSLQEDDDVLRKLREAESKLEIIFSINEEIIIDGLPAGIPADEQEIVLQVFASISVKMVADDILACHTLPGKKGLAPVIVKVVSRKHANLAI